MNDPVLSALQEEFEAIAHDLRDDGSPQELFDTYARMIWTRLHEIDQVKAYAVARALRLRKEIAGIESWRGEAVRRVLAEANKHKKTKYVDTPYGRLGYRKAAPSCTWRAEDEPAVVEWAREHLPDAVTEYVPAPRYTLKKTDLRSALDAGQAIPHVLPTGGGDEFYFRAAKPAGECNEDDADGNLGF